MMLDGLCFQLSRQKNSPLFCVCYSGNLDGLFCVIKTNRDWVTLGFPRVRATRTPTSAYRYPWYGVWVQVQGCGYQKVDAACQWLTRNTGNYQRNSHILILLSKGVYFFLKMFLVTIDVLRFGYFFDTPVQNNAAPHALGYHGFFRGLYSYDFHNFW